LVLRLLLDVVISRTVVV